jgi:UDP-2,3-diacylglucosamine hydrolase
MSAPGSRPIYVSGDVHLGAVAKGREAAFLGWLEHAAASAGQIILNGDLFDFWFEYRSVIPRGHTRVLGALAAAVDAGVPVTLVGGNHDWWGGSYFEDELGVTFLRDPVVVELAGRRAFLAHGDGLGRGDLKYKALRWMLRGGPTRWAFRWLHPDIGARIARMVSKTEDRRLNEDEKRRAEALEAWGIARLRSDPSLELVVLGHSHVPVLREVDPGRWYVNSGDWVVHQAYVVLEPGQPPRMLEWDVSGPAARRRADRPRG